MTHHGDESQHHDDQHLAPSPDEPAGVPGDQVTSDGGVSADPLDGQNATGGYGDESTGFSDQADRDPGEDATDVNGGNADR